MPTSRRPAVAVGLALGLAALATVTSACSYASPAVITTPYAASDGSNAELGAVKFRNFLVVSEGKGKPGVVVGAVAVDGADPVEVQLGVLDASGGSPVGQTRLTAQPGRLVGVGTGEGAVPLQLDEVPVPPGAVLTLAAHTAAGSTEFAIPVLPPTNEYATITPAATSSSPTASPTGTAGAAVSPSTSPSASPAGGTPAPSGSTKASGSPTATSSSR